MTSSFIAPNGYRKALTRLVTEEESLDVAVAFWGDGAQKLILPVKTKPIRIICNLKTGGTNPGVIESFLTLSREVGLQVQIRQCEVLHAKVVIGKTQAVIGSANISANGLGLEDEDSAHWLEAGVHIRERSELDKMQAWFDSLWSSAHVSAIKNSDIQAAQIAWERNRQHPTPATASIPEFFSFTDFTIPSLRRAKAYALLYRQDLSPSAKATLKAAQSQSVAPQHNFQTDIRLWGYENWPDFPSDIRAEYVDVRWGNRTGVRVFGACRLLGQRAKVEYDDSALGTLDIANPVETLLDLPFGKQAQKLMELALKPYIEAVWKAANGDDYVRVIHLADIAKILQDAGEASQAIRRISGKEAVQVLASLSAQVELRARDNKDKFWCYKLKSRIGTEFAFDPNTTGRLYLRLDRQPPNLPGLTHVENISAANKSTSLGRVFSGGIHHAAYKVTVESESTLRDLIDHLMAL
ncbi:phospholipase D family protein [Pseudomonas orientalis]|uniref:phospholipase D family protein n=1 Tax=Pseudomonas orientalis TaxID=76758 RepID=UPI0039856BAD